jgi:hypothetical protein
MPRPAATTMSAAMAETIKRFMLNLRSVETSEVRRDSVYWLGLANMTNEGAYLFRKLGAF